jgi:RimJ/RimL family protein N-acetyltransferase
MGFWTSNAKDSGPLITLAMKMKALEKYGIRLRPMTADDLERVRKWRNAPHVRREMAFQEVISPEMQVKWWGQLDLERNFYWMIEVEGHEVGVVHAKDIDWQEKSAETGIFIGEREYLQGFVPVLAVLAMMDGLFEVYGLEVLRAKVKAGNPVILNFNAHLGYRVISEADGFLHLSVTREGYFERAKTLRASAARRGISGGNSAST